MNDENKNNPNRSDHMEDIFSSNTIPPIEPEKPEQGQIPTPDVAPTTAFIPQQTQPTPDQMQPTTQIPPVNPPYPPINQPSQPYTTNMVPPTMGYSPEGMPLQTPGAIPPPPPKKPLSSKAKKGIIFGSIGGGVLIIVAIILCIVLLGGGKKFDLGKYYMISVQGMNGNATAEVITNDSITDTELMKDLGLKSNQYSELVNYAGFFQSVSAELSKTEGISNGDTIEATLTYDEDLAEELHIKIKNSKLSLQVKGLKDGTKIDVFEDLQVTFTGIAPKGEVEIVNNSTDDFVSDIYFSADKTSGLSNGDVVTITANYDKYQAQDELLVVTQETKEFTVEGLSEYLTSAEQITDEVRAALDNKAKEAVNASLAESWSTYYEKFSDKYYYSTNKISVSDPVISTQSLLVGKDPEGYYWDGYNRLIYIYQVTIDISSDSTFGDKPDGPKTGYIAVALSDICILNGEVVVDNVEKPSPYGDCSTNNVTLIDELINANKVEYNVIDIKPAA